MNVSKITIRRSQSPPRRLRACVPCTKARAQCHFQPRNVDRHLCDRCEKLGRFCEEKTGTALRRPRRIRGGKEAVAGEGNPSAGSDSISDGGTSNLPFSLTSLQAARILHIYRTKYTPNFPFIPIPESITINELYQQRPMVFRSIMLIAAPLPAPREETIKNEVLEYLGSKLLVADSRTLDTLQGILICIAWANLNNLCDERITTLTYMALGIAHTLGITKTPLPVLRKLDKDKKPAEDIRKGGKGDTHGMRLHSKEEQRAYLGLYYVLSINSVHFGRKNPLNGAYVPHCLEAILTANETATDSTLIHLIRMTQISEKISSPNLSERDTEAYVSLLEGSNRTIKAELDQLREGIAEISPFAGQQDQEVSASRCRYFELGYYYLIARLNEPATHLPDILASGGTASAHRSLRLHYCLDAVIDYFEMMLSLSPESMLYQSLAFSEQATFILILATRLCASTAGAKDWDVEKIRQKVDMATIVRKLVAKMEDADASESASIANFMEEIGVETGEEEREAKGLWGVMAEKMGNIGAWFDKMYAGNNKGDETGAEIDELLYRVGVYGREGGQSGIEEADGPAWLGLLPMGSFGWRVDDI